MGAQNGESSAEQEQFAFQDMQVANETDLANSTKWTGVTQLHFSIDASKSEQIRGDTDRLYSAPKFRVEKACRVAHRKLPTSANTCPNKTYVN